MFGLMIRSTFMVGFVVLFMAGLAGCGEDDGTEIEKVDCAEGFAVATVQTAAAFSDAADAYNADPSKANCDAYRTASQDYLNSLYPFGNCVYAPDETAAFAAALKSAQGVLNELDCN
jgi:hypothetical protein